MPVFGPPQVMFVRGAGTELWDAGGTRYLDFLCGLAVTSLGHSHPAITEAIATQAGRLLHVSNFFTNDAATAAAIELRDLLAEATGDQGQVFFCNSGAEANEAALKLARKFGGSGRHVVISAYGSFHGRTLAALAATGQPAKHEPFFPMPDGFRRVAYGDAAALEAALDPSVSAVIIETVQGEGGVVPADASTCGRCGASATKRHAADRRRGADRLRPHGSVVRLRARRRPPGRRHDGEGDGQRLPRRRRLGTHRRRRGLRARRPRQHVQRDRDRHGRRVGGDPRDAPHRCAGTRGGEGRCCASGSSHYRACERCAARGCCSPSSWATAPARRRCTPSCSRGLVTNAVTATAVRLAPPITVSEAEIDEAVAIIGTALAAGVGVAP
ncbi:MAG: aminotransferase class III-fold pyridoxal phosphate-dependent enzyme [Ilumatobacteraceae bacterium]